MQPINLTVSSFFTHFVYQINCCNDSLDHLSTFEAVVIRIAQIACTIFSLTIIPVVCYCIWGGREVLRTPPSTSPSPSPTPELPLPSSDLATQPSRIHILTLPPEIIKHIFSFLPPKSLEATVLVCRKWRDLTIEGAATNELGRLNQFLPEGQKVVLNSISTLRAIKATVLTRAHFVVTSIHKMPDDRISPAKNILPMWLKQIVPYELDYRNAMKLEVGNAYRALLLLQTSTRWLELGAIEESFKAANALPSEDQKAEPFMSIFRKCCQLEQFDTGEKLIGSLPDAMKDFFFVPAFQKALELNDIDRAARFASATSFPGSKNKNLELLVNHFLPTNLLRSLEVAQLMSDEGTARRSFVLLNIMKKFLTLGDLEHAIDAARGITYNGYKVEATSALVQYNHIDRAIAFIDSIEDVPVKEMAIQRLISDLVELNKIDEAERRAEEFSDDCKDSARSALAVCLHKLGHKQKATEILLLIKNEATKRWCVEAIAQIDSAHTRPSTPPPKKFICQRYYFSDDPTDYTNIEFEYQSD